MGWSRVPVMGVLGLACGAPHDAGKSSPDAAVGTDSGQTSDSQDSGPGPAPRGGPTLDSRVELGVAKTCSAPELRTSLGAFEHLDHVFDAAGLPSPPDQAIQAGVTAEDFDGDGHMDILMIRHEGVDLFMGDGAGGLRQATDQLPEPRSGFSNHAAAVAADFDADGDLDVVVANRNTYDELWWNDGSGSFTRDGADPFASELRASVGASLADVDGDGDLDLFLAGHYAGLSRSEPDPSALYLWTGTAFVLAPTAIPVSTDAGYTFNGTWLNADGDGVPDLYLVNDHGNVALPNQLLSNTSSEGAVSFAPNAEAGLDAAMLGMGVALADFNQDTLPDIIVTNFGQLHLYESLADGTWYESSLSRGLAQDLTTQVVGWSVIAEDFDNDADLDVWTTFGSLPVSHPDYDNPMEQPDALWVQQDGRFEDGAPAWGLDDEGVGRGGIAVDLNEDGWLDIVTAPLITMPRVHLSRCGEASWLMVDLEQGGANPAAIGARVEVTANEHVHTRWVVSGGTQIFGSPPSLVHVGLGDATEVQSIWVTWPDGETSEVGPVAVNQVVQVVRSE